MEQAQRKTRVGRACQGQALVEFALLLPILVVIVMGICEFGRAFMVNHLLTTAAREAARTAVVLSDLTANDPRAVGAASRAQQILDSGRLTGATMTNTMPNPSDCAVQVQVQYNLIPITGNALRFAIGDSIPLRSSTTMRYEPGCP